MTNINPWYLAIGAIILGVIACVLAALWLLERKVNKRPLPFQPQPHRQIFDLLAAAQQFCNLVQDENDDFLKKTVRFLAKQAGVSSIVLLKETEVLANYGKVDDSLQGSTGSIFRRPLTKKIAMLVDGGSQLPGEFIEFEALMKNVALLFELRLEREEKKQALMEARKDSRTDGLTGLPNRLGWFEHVLDIIAFQKSQVILDKTQRRGTVTSHERRTPRLLAIFMVDLDRFKRYNDKYGHPAGDAALVKLAKLLREFAKRGLDRAGRYGGEEFCIATLVDSTDEAKTYGEDLRAAVERLDLGDIHRHITVSIGVRVLKHSELFSLAPRIAVADDPEEEGDDMLARLVKIFPEENINALLGALEQADQELYEAKKTRNFVTLRPPN